MSISDETNTSINIDANKTLGQVRLILKGLKRTNQRVILPDVQQIQDATTVLELFRQLENSCAKLEKLGLFSNIVSRINRGLRPGDVDVVFEFKEREPSYTLGANANNRGETNIEVKAQIPGILSTCNSLAFSLTTAGRYSNELNGTCYIPRVTGLPKYTGKFNIFASQNDYTSRSAFSTLSRGARFGLADAANRHVFTWEAALEDIYPTFNDTRRASISVLKNSGRSFKNSVAYAYTLDKLQGQGIPDQGHCTLLKLETGLPGGDRQFFKVDYSMLLARRFYDKLVLHTSLGGGYLKSFNAFNSPEHLLDKFHFTGASGAATSFKGFGYHGVGPCDFGGKFDKEKQSWENVAEHMGGDYYANVQVACHYAIPINKKLVPNLYAFGNIGAISNHKVADFMPSRDLRASIGAGFSIPLFNGCWFEATYALPLAHGPHDTLQGYQIGLRFKNNRLN